MPTWSQEDGLDALRQEIASQLPPASRTLNASEYPEGGSDWYVHDVGIGGTWALLCSYGGSETRWAVAEIAWDTGAPVLQARRDWTAVEQQFVSKAKTALAIRHAGLSEEEALRLLELSPDEPSPSIFPKDPEIRTFDYALTKSAPEKRYTFGPLYAPDRLDAHGEYTDADTLQDAQWEYVRASSSEGRRLRLQHDQHDGPENLTVGEWVDIVSWPLETEVTITVPGTANKAAETKTVTLPAGTTYMGVVWDEAAWPAVKSGKIGGLSLGGRAIRVREATHPEKRMGDPAS